MTEIKDDVDRWISYDQFNQFRITPFIIGHCIKQLKTGKNNGSESFNSNNLINGGYRLHVLLYLLFNCMMPGTVYYTSIHCHTPRNLLASTVIPIPEDMGASLCKRNNYGAVLCAMSFVRYLIMLLCIYVMIYIPTSELQSGFKQNHSTVL